MTTKILACLAFLLVGAAAPAQPGTDRAADRVRAHVEFLADDLLEGRDTGSRGHEIAAVYVASQFRAAGLQPGGEKGGWYQQVPFRRASYETPPTATLTIGGTRIPLAFGKDFATEPSVTERERSIESDLVFVGYGYSDTKRGWDDYAGLDVRGKTVVALNGSPPGLPTEIAAHLSATSADVAAAHGAIGFIGISRKEGQGSRPDSLRRYSERPSIDWVDQQGRAGSYPAGLRYIGSVSPEIATRLFQGAARSLTQVRADVANNKRRIRGFPLRAHIAFQATNVWQDFTSPEVIGLLPGSDPKLRNEYVVLMGHLDHLGVKKNAKPGEDAIYNGALDNASGVATLLEAAQRFTGGERPRRSVLFVVNTGEEKGLLGADYFAAHPTVPIGNIVAGVDLDMPLPLYDFNDINAFGGEHSTVAETIARAGASMGVKVSPDPMPQESLFVRSDHYQLVKRGVPAVLMFTGYGNGGAAIWPGWLKNIYHSPKDDLSQPINWNALAKYGELNYRIARELADAPQRPLWYQGDYFGDTFAPGQPRAKRR